MSERVRESVSERVGHGVSERVGYRPGDADVV